MEHEYEPVHDYEIPGLAKQRVRDMAGSFEADFTEDSLFLKLVALDSMAEWLEEEKGRHIARMRIAGSSWSEIGEALGVSKQAAAKKYGKTD
jgi:hypothetical protein